MRVQETEQVKKLIHQDHPLFFAIGPQNKEIIDYYFSCFQDSIKKFDSCHFSPSAFLQEVHTYPMFSKKHTIYVSNLEELKVEWVEVITNYCKKPHAWIRLFLQASSFSIASTLAKAVDKAGLLYYVAEEKPWEKEKRLADWLIQEAKQKGVNLPPFLAASFIKHLGKDQALLINELEKLICYIGDKKEITQTDIQAISSWQGEENLWQFSDAIFSLNTSYALDYLKKIFEKETSIFSLLPFLKSQVLQAQEIIKIYHTEGSQGVTRAFPFLKGALLEKKLILLNKLGYTYFKRASQLIFESELEAKNSQKDSEMILEILVVRLTQQLPKE